MSSYRVPDLQIVLIAHYRHCVEFCGVQKPWPGFDAVTREIAEMIELNEQAVFTRYEGRHNSDQFTFPREMPLIERVKIAEKMHDQFFASGKLIKPSPAQMCKYADNYLYQCAESDELTNTHTYKTIKQFADTCARVAIGQAYKHAEWGFAE